MSLNWNQLFLTGTVVTLKTSRWSARIQLKPSDLGIEDSDEVQSALSLGCHRLAPAKAFEGIREWTNAARRLVDRYSLNFGLIRGARYVPDAHMEKLMAKLREYRANHDSAVEEFIANYEKVKAEQMPIIEKALKDAAKDEESAARAFERIQAEYPSADEVRAKFGLRWSVYTVQGAKSAAAVTTAADEAQDVKEMISEMVGQLRTDFADKVKDLLSMVKKGGKLSRTSVESALEVLDRVESLNVLGDSVLSGQVQSLRSALAGIDTGSRVEDDFVEGLETIEKELAESVERAVIDAEKNLTGLGRRKIGG